jgi:hypothetical protein
LRTILVERPDGNSTTGRTGSYFRVRPGAGLVAEDLGAEDLGAEDLGAEDLGAEDLCAEDFGTEDLGARDVAATADAPWIGSFSRNAASRSSCSVQKRWYLFSQRVASSIGAAVSRQATVRPVFAREIRPASVSTSRCFMIAGSDIVNGRASSLIVTPSCSLSLASKARRVGSASAANVRSSGWA